MSGTAGVAAATSGPGGVGGSLAGTSGAGAAAVVSTGGVSGSAGTSDSSASSGLAGSAGTVAGGGTTASGGAPAASGGGTGGSSGMPMISPNLMGASASTEGCDRGPAIVETNCSIAGCHLDNFKPNFVGDFIAELRGVESELCQGRPFVDPVDPANSYIIEKINPAPCDGDFITGLQMPVTPMAFSTINPLPQEDIQCLTDWILAVAAP